MGVTGGRCSHLQMPPPSFSAVQPTGLRQSFTAGRACQLGLVSDGSPCTRPLVSFIEPEAVFAPNLHAFACAESRAWNDMETHSWSLGCLHAEQMELRCTETRAIKVFSPLALRPPLGNPFLHSCPPNHCPMWHLGPKSGSGRASQSGSLGSPGRSCILALWLRISSPCLHLSLVYRSSRSGGCVLAEASLHSFTGFKSSCAYNAPMPSVLK